MQADEQTRSDAQIDRFTDRLLVALANLDKYANGYDKRESYAPATPPPAARGEDTE